MFSIIIREKEFRYERKVQFVLCPDSSAYSTVREKANIQMITIFRSSLIGFDEGKWAKDIDEA